MPAGCGHAEMLQWFWCSILLGLQYIAAAAVFIWQRTPEQHVASVSLQPSSGAVMHEARFCQMLLIPRGTCLGLKSPFITSDFAQPLLLD